RPGGAGSLSGRSAAMTMAGVAEREAARTTATTAAATAAAKPSAQDVYFACRDIHAYYGESYVVQGVSLELREGEVLALLGRNGAGKTSTLRTIARASVPVLKRGEIYLGGKPIHPLRSFEAAQAGIQLVPEDRRI